MLARLDSHSSMKSIPAVHTVPHIPHVVQLYKSSVYFVISFSEIFFGPKILAQNPWLLFIKSFHLSTLSLGSMERSLFLAAYVGQDLTHSPQRVHASNSINCLGLK